MFYGTNQEKNRTNCLDSLYRFRIDFLNAGVDSLPVSAISGSGWQWRRLTERSRGMVCSQSSSSGQSMLVQLATGDPPCRTNSITDIDHDLDLAPTVRSRSFFPVDNCKILLASVEAYAPPEKRLAGRLSEPDTAVVVFKYEVKIVTYWPILHNSAATVLLRS